MARLAAQHHEIDRLNEAHAGRFRLIKGIEANILADGGVDMTRESVVSSSSWSPRRTPASGRQPTRPGGSSRLYVPPVSTSSGIREDAIRRAARRRGRLDGNSRRQPRERSIQIDGDPSRQDIDHELARLRSTPAASSRSTATRTRRTSGPSRRPLSRTPGSRHSVRACHQHLAGRFPAGVARGPTDSGSRGDGGEGVHKTRNGVNGDETEKTVDSPDCRIEKARGRTARSAGGRRACRRAQTGRELGGLCPPARP